MDLIPNYNPGGSLASSEKKKYDTALELKMKNAAIEHQLGLQQQIEQEKFNREGMGSGALSNFMYGQAGLEGQGARPLAELQLLGRERVAGIRSGGSGGVDINSLIEPTLANPELYDTYDARTRARLIPHLSKRGFAHLGKPMGSDKQRLVDASVSGLGSISRIERMFDDAKGDYAQYFLPGKLGANKLKVEVALLKDLYEKILTGAASNSREDVTYRTLVAPSISEVLEDVADGSFDGELMKYKLSNIKEHLKRAAANRPSAVSVGRTSVADPFKAGLPVSGEEKLGKDDQVKEILDALRKAGIKTK